MRVRNHLLVVALSGVALSVAAQTGRIALASHAGRVAEDSDNFGIVPKPRPEWRADTLVYINDSLALHVGQVRGWIQVNKHGQIVWRRQAEQVDYQVPETASPQAVVEEMRKVHPHAVFVGFDKWGQHPKSKQLKGTQVFSKRPFQYSYWREVAGAAALGMVGWLLGRRPGQAGG